MNRTRMNLAYRIAIFLGAVLVVVCFPLGLFVDVTPSRHITNSAYDRIPLGMEKTQVEAILGPPGKYFSGAPDPCYVADTRWGCGCMSDGNINSTFDVSDWHGDHGGIRIKYDRNNTVSVKVFCYPKKKIIWYRWVIYTSPHPNRPGTR